VIYSAKLLEPLQAVGSPVWLSCSESSIYRYLLFRCPNLTTLIISSHVARSCPLYNSKPQYFLSLCRYVGHKNHKVFLFIALKQLLEPAVYLQQSFRICFAAFLSELQGSNWTELIWFYVVLLLELSEAEYFWIRRCWRLRRREHWSGDSWVMNWQGLLLTDRVWICWDVWGQESDVMVVMVSWG